MRLFTTIALAAVGLAAGTAAAVAPAVAAPQILGLMASKAPIPLRCDGPTCSAIAGTFCLQRERDIPQYGMPYRPTHAEQLTLAVLTRDGTVRRLPAGGRLSFAGYDGYTTIRMSVPKAVLADLGATAVAVEIGPGVALVPTPQAGDANPQAADEVALATGPVRLAAGRYLDKSAPDADAARLVTALLNALPEHYSIHDDYSHLWQTAITDDVAGTVDPTALPQAQDALRKCSNSQQMMRSCLVYRHRELMEPDNIRFWQEMGGY
jgi:hypothetical protein